MGTLREELETVLESRQILTDEPLGRHTTFRVGGPADFYLMPRVEQISAVMDILARRGVERMVIGNGSNLLVSDNGIRGAVVEIGKQMAEISVDGETARAQAGALLAQAAQAAYHNGLSGLEFAAGIPGSVGGAMVMNAGAYGGEMKDIVTKVKVLAEDGSVKELSNKEMDFAYRKSCILEKGYLVLEAEFSLKRQEKGQIKEQMELFRKRRVSKQPLEFPSAGSTFKRPEGYFAGKLIMDAGLAGYAVGGAKVSEKHCGFVVNAGGASAADVLAVIRHAQRTVKERFGVELQTEVKLAGEFKEGEDAL